MSSSWSASSNICRISIGAFAQLRQLIVAGALLYIEVPDVTAFADWPNAPFQDFGTEHINFFSPISIRNLMRRHGFSQMFLEQNHRVQSFRTVMSNISAFFCKEASAEEAFEFDTTSAIGLERYVSDCIEADRTLRQRIDEVVDAKQPILVWGVGTHTSRLMATSRLADAEIVGVHRIECAVPRQVATRPAHHGSGGAAGST